MRIFKEGDKGSEVKRIQTLLREVGVKPKVSANGKFDGTTERAVKAFQKKIGLKATGTVDWKTLEKLEAAAAKPIKWTLPATLPMRTKIKRIIAQEILNFSDAEDLVKKIGKDKEADWAMRDYKIDFDTFHDYAQELCDEIETLGKHKKKFDKTEPGNFQAWMWDQATESWADIEERNQIAGKLKRRLDSSREDAFAVLRPLAA
ncbi:MAG: peptidoglycan-binding domain-containing protein [Pseudomonadota bacterium]